MARAILWVACHEGTTLLQAGHSARFCLKLSCGLDSHLLFSFFFFLACQYKRTPVVLEPAVLYANQMPIAGVAATGQLVP